MVADCLSIGKNSSAGLDLPNKRIRRFAFAGFIATAIAVSVAVASPPIDMDQVCGAVHQFQNATDPFTFDTAAREFVYSAVYKTCPEIGPQIIVENKLDDIIGDLECDDISQSLNRVFLAISSLKAAISQAKDTDEPKKKVVRTSKQLIERLEKVCEAVANIQENNGNPAIVLILRDSRSQPDAKSATLVADFSLAYSQMLDKLDTALWPALIAELKKADDPGVSMPLYMEEDPRLTVHLAGQSHISSRGLNRRPE